MKTIGIIGSRSRNTNEDQMAIWIEFKKFYDIGDRICSGGCPKGGDRFAELIAARIGLTKENGGLIIHYPKPVPKGSPKYVYAKVNYERNTLIARDSDILIACVSLDRIGGTEDTIKKWKRFGNDPVNLILV